jgi:uncharacterized protein (DUF3820 family)
MTVFKFGRYKDKSIEEVIGTDPPYCIWLYKNNIFKENSRAHQLLHKYFENDKNYYMRFGKYKNMSLQYIAQIDSNYINWLKKSNIARDNEELQKALKI